MAAFATLCKASHGIWMLLSSSAHAGCADGEAAAGLVVKAVTAVQVCVLGWPCGEWLCGWGQVLVLHMPAALHCSSVSWKFGSCAALWCLRGQQLLIPVTFAMHATIARGCLRPFFLLMSALFCSRMFCVWVAMCSLGWGCVLRMLCSVAVGCICLGGVLDCLKC
jgi:hypothetical protein